jgi:hypothetical protein
MVYFKINDPNNGVKYIKEVDGAKGTLEFQEDKKGCMCKDEGFYADSEFSYLQFHFKEKYPELQYMTKESSWG